MNVSRSLVKASAHRLAHRRPIRWSGYDWQARGVISSMGPGPNAWSDFPQNLSVDADGNLTLSIVEHNGVYTCCELEGPSLGYGTYRCRLATNPTNIDIKPVFGLFTYDDSDDGSNAYREIDIEVTKWNYVPEPSRIWYTAQPSTEPSTSDHGVTAAVPYTLEFTWQPGLVYFKTSDNNGVVLGQHVVQDAVPTPGNETIRLNFWLVDGDPPTNGQSTSITVREFEFIADDTYDLQSASTIVTDFTDGENQCALKLGATLTASGLEIECLPSDYGLAVTGSVYDMTGSSVDIEVVGVPEVGNHTTEAIWFVRYDADNYAAMFFADGLLFCRLRSAGVTTQVNLAYDAVQHRHWRISEAGGDLQFDTSPDRTSWVNRWTTTHGLGTKIEAMRIRLECGYYGSESNPSPFVVAGINC